VIHEAFMLMHIDRFAEAERRVRSVLSTTIAPADMPPLPRLCLGAIRFHTGRWKDIEQYLSPDVDPARDTPDDEAWSIASALLTVTFVHSDRIQEAETLAPRAVRVLATGSRPLMLWAALLVAEATGDTAEAALLADRLISSLDFLESPIGLRTSGPDLVRVFVHVGEPMKAEAIAQALEALAPATGVPSVLAAAKLSRGVIGADADSLMSAARSSRLREGRSSEVWPWRPSVRFWRTPIGLRRSPPLGRLWKPIRRWVRAVTSGESPPHCAQWVLERAGGAAGRGRPWAGRHCPPPSARWREWWRMASATTRSERPSGFHREPWRATSVTP
jgi:hypothetical protein